MRLSSFKSIPVVVGLVSALFSWDTVYAANLCEGSTEYAVSKATGNSSNSRRTPDRAIDGKTADWSRWSTNGKGQSLVLDLGKSRDIDQIQTLWLFQSSRTSYFDVDTSTNGSSWTNVLSSAATDRTSSMLTFDLQGTSARYVKIIGQGNSSNNWNHIIEAKVFGCEEEETPAASCSRNDNLAINSAFTYDSIDANYTPSLAIDGSLATTSRWSSKGVGQSMTVDLGEVSTVREISTAWYKGNVRQAYFDVQTSTNNSNWTTVLSNGVAQGSLGMIDFNVTDSTARYVKFIGKGNSTSTWNSIVEIDIYGCGNTETDEPSDDSPGDDTPTNDESIALIQSLFDLEGGDNDLNPVQGNTMVFDALAAAHVTPNGNGWRHEYKMATENRRAMSETSEDFSARIKLELSTGSKTIVAQYHGGDLGTLVKIYISDTNESGHDDSVANNGIFDVYARVKEEGSSSETILDFGTIRSGNSIDLVLNNRAGQVYVSAMGIDQSYSVADSDQAYLKFGNYLQAQEAVSGDNIDDSDDWADFYRDAGITQSKVTFSNINYYQY